ncbi:penicillin-binding protein [Aeromicrobium sp. 179-A 4D2 NHS]|uniref:penicillin-binding protein n=1 Tax=Aeromicrobium sp. 179-A 4D2 NHS TaxID=3142375 RepID=UPI0039A1E435
MRKHVTDSGLDIFNGVDTFPTPKRRRLRTIALSFVTLPLCGVLLGATTIPLALTASGTTKAALDTWENMPHDLGAIAPAQKSIIVDSTGKTYATVFTQNRTVVTLDQIAPVMVQALLDTEDARFREHGAADVKGLGRAATRNLLAGASEGGSTITQQLVENLRVLSATNDTELAAAKPSTIAGKMQELRYAVELERTLTKDQILEQYLNSVYFGNGAYGVAAAADRYWGTTADKLTIDQAATLVAMLKSPTVYDPIHQPNNSMARRNVVLGRMLAEGHLTQTEYDRLSVAPTKLKPKTPKSGCSASKYPYYCELVINELLTSSKFGKTKTDRQRLLATGGLRITTALNPKAMRSANRAVARAMTNGNRVAVGVAVVQPGTGKVLGIAQNRTYGNSKGKTQMVYPASNFQIGSTFKPIVTAAAIERGIGPKTRYNSPSGVHPRGVDAPPGGFRNDGYANFGSIDAYEATKKSVNSYFVQMIAEAGVKNTANMARRLGMTSIPEKLTGREASLALGAFETSPIQVASVYATFAARGVACTPHVITSYARLDGTGKTKTDGDCHQAIMPTIADQVADTLQAPYTDGGTATGLKPKGRKAAGKTGTTNGTSATWFAGFVPQAATAVWVGDPRGGNKYPLESVVAYGKFQSPVFGRTVAGPVFADTMNGYLSGMKPRWLPAPKSASATLTTRTVPSVVGLSVPAAISSLTNAGFKVTVAKNAKEADKWVTGPGYVIKQTPDPGLNTGWGTKVTITPTAGTAPVKETP